MAIAIFPRRHQHGIGYVEWRFILAGQRNGYGSVGKLPLDSG